jgi:hypothetical protein
MDVVGRSASKMAETNYEHYKDELIKLLLLEHTLCDFKRKNVLKVTQCSAPNIPCEECDKRVREWFNQPYEEPVIEIDWSRVPVDTPVYVSNNINPPSKYNDCRYLKIFDKAYDVPFIVWSGGKTSFTSSHENDVVHYQYCTLARPEDIEKYRKK